MGMGNDSSFRPLFCYHRAMPRVPDRFDLWVRRARAERDPARAADLVLGALVALPEWHFIDGRTRPQPYPACAEELGKSHFLVFSDLGRIAEISPGLRTFSLPTAAAIPWFLEQRDVDGLLVNLGEDAFIVSLPQFEFFYRAWKESKNAAGFWVPNLTSEEEDFWQEHGL